MIHYHSTSLFVIFAEPLCIYWFLYTKPLKCDTFYDAKVHYTTSFVSFPLITFCKTHIKHRIEYVN